MLRHAPSGHLFGMTQNAGMGWKPKDIWRKQSSRRQRLWQRLTEQDGINPDEVIHQRLAVVATRPR